MVYPSIFPDPLLADENGIVAFSRTITPQMLIDAYYHGLFPWPFGEQHRLIPWCAPARRGVIPLNEFHIPASFARELKKSSFTLRVDHDFAAVITACADAVRPEQSGTWISPLRSLMPTANFTGWAMLTVLKFMTAPMCLPEVFTVSRSVKFSAAKACSTAFRVLQNPHW